MTRVWSPSDGRVHAEERVANQSEPLTRCGRKVTVRLTHVEEGEECPTCFGHPLAEVWQQCRAWDDQYAALIGRRS